MSEIEAGAPMFRAVVVTQPQNTQVDDEPVSVTVNVRYRGKKPFAVIVDSRSRHFGELTSLRPGDEMYVSYDGEDICNIKHNPWWKKLWLRLIW